MRILPLCPTLGNITFSGCCCLHFRHLMFFLSIGDMDKKKLHLGFAITFSICFAHAIGSVVLHLLKRLFLWSTFDANWPSKSESCIFVSLILIGPCGKGHRSWTGIVAKVWLKRFCQCAFWWLQQIHKNCVEIMFYFLLCDQRSIKGVCWIIHEDGGNAHWRNVAGIDRWQANY